METICVDIGNSGLRCVRLPNQPASAAVARPTTGLAKSGSDVPWQGEVLRIDWPGAAVSSGAPDPNAGGDDAATAQATLGTALERWLDGDVGRDVARVVAERPARRWVVSSVQRATEAHLRSCAARLGAAEFHVVTHSELDLQVDVDYPERVGVDRLLSALAALELSEARPLIVIQAGSAITVDWVEAPRRFCGGAIMPGVPMMLRLLSRAADLLPEVAADELLELPALPGRNTAAAMFAGASSAVVGGVQHLVARYRSQFGAATPIVLSGGDGPRLAPHLAGPLLTADHLVLRGLAAWASLGRGVRRA
ncbi:MAG: type III pantothenate kinase [Aureliella sp.]